MPSVAQASVNWVPTSSMDDTNVATHRRPDGTPLRPTF